MRDQQFKSDVDGFDLNDVSPLSLLTSRYHLTWLPILPSCRYFPVVILSLVDSAPHSHDALSTNR